MTASQVAEVLAKSEARRHKAMVDSIYTPELREALDRFQRTAIPPIAVDPEWVKKLSEITARQKPRIEIPRPLMEQVAKQFAVQNQDLIDTVRKASFANIKFDLPEGYLKAIAAWRSQLADEALEEGDPNAAAERLQRIAWEREWAIKCLYRVGMGLEGFAYMPNSPVPHFVAYLVLLIAMLGEVADEYLTERENDN